MMATIYIRTLSKFTSHLKQKPVYFSRWLPSYKFFHDVHKNFFYFNTKPKKNFWRRLAILGGGFVFVTNMAQNVHCFLMEDITETVESYDFKPIEMNEAAALTHASLLRQSSCIAVDAAVQLVHRGLRATLDTSQDYKKLLHETMYLLEQQIITSTHPEKNDDVWDLFVVSRAELDSAKQQLQDLKMLLGYAYMTLENASLAACLSGSDFTSSSAQLIINHAKMELSTEENVVAGLEKEYLSLQTLHIKLVQEKEDKRLNQGQSKVALEQDEIIIDPS